MTATHQVRLHRPLPYHTIPSKVGVQFSSGKKKRGGDPAEATYAHRGAAAERGPSMGGAVMGVGFLELSLVVFVSLFTI